MDKRLVPSGGAAGNAQLGIAFLLKWANPGLFFVYFGLFKTNKTIFTTNQCEKCHVHPV